MINKKINKNDLIACLFFLLLGIWVVYQTEEFTFLGSVFPKVVAYVMIACSILYVLISYFFGWDKVSSLRGSTVKRFLIYLVIVAWAISINYLGFLISSLVFYFLSLLISGGDDLTVKKAFLYMVYGGFFIAVMYFIFVNVLSVPLPNSKLF